MAEKKHIRELRVLFARHGIDITKASVDGGSHFRLDLHRNGFTAHTNCAMSSSDPRNHHNVLTKAKRALRDAESRKIKA